MWHSIANAVPYAPNTTNAAASTASTVGPWAFPSAEAVNGPAVQLPFDILRLPDTIAEKLKLLGASLTLFPSSQAFAVYMNGTNFSTYVPFTASAEFWNVALDHMVRQSVIMRAGFSETKQLK